jgi:hypothetical protein
MIFQRFSVQFAILSIILDADLTLLALVAAMVLRPSPTPFHFLHSLPKVHFPLALYLLVPLPWIAIFLVASVYDPERTFKAIEESRNLTIATSRVALYFAGLGFDVVGIDNDMRFEFFGDEASTLWNRQRLESTLGEQYRHVDADIRNYGVINKIFGQHGSAIKVVIHAAAQPSDEISGADCVVSGSRRIMRKITNNLRTGQRQLVLHHHARGIL